MTVAVAPPLRHDALLYGSDDEFTSTVEPFVRAGLDAGDAVVVVTGAANAALLRDALGPSSASVPIIDALEWYRHPAETVAGYRRVLDERLDAGAQLVRVVGEVQFGETAERQRDWVAYEAVINHVFAQAPAWIVCPYDVRALPEAVVRHAAHTHPFVQRRGLREVSGDYRAPEQVLRQLGAAGQAQPEAVLAAEFEVEGALQPVRQGLRALAARHGLGARRVDELTVAVNEVLTNAVRHGRPPVSLRVYTDPSRIICDVTDGGGTFSDLLAGQAPPPALRRPEGGMGLWVARRLTDRVEVLAVEGRTVLRLTKSNER